MRMSAHELGGDGFDDAAEIKQAGLFRHAGMKDDLQQKIAKLLAQIFRPSALDRVGHLIGLFDGERGNRGEGLLDVPRATVNRITKRRHDVDETANVAGRLHGRGQQSGNGTIDYWRKKERRKGAPELWLGSFRARAKSPRGLWACPPLSSSPVGLPPNAKCRPDLGPRYGRIRLCRRHRWRRNQTPWRRQTI